MSPVREPNNAYSKTWRRSPREFRCTQRPVLRLEFRYISVSTFFAGACVTHTMHVVTPLLLPLRTDYIRGVWVLLLDRDKQGDNVLHL